MKVFLIAGKARSGKDTLGDFFFSNLEKEGKKVCKMRMATYIYYYATKYFGWDGKDETKPRELLQQLGTEIIRKQVDPKFHVKRFIEDVKVLSFFFDYAVITDVREPLEIEYPKEHISDVVAISIERPDNTSYNELNSKQQKHYTELALDNFNDYDYKVVNDGTLEDLEKKVLDILEKEDLYEKDK